MSDTTTAAGELRQRFVEGMSHAASTVNIVTTDGAAGRAGVTVSAMSSVSADTPKPTLLVCVHHASAAAAKILENGVFCVNILRDDQSYISDTFAGRFKDSVDDKFDCAEWTTQVTGAPRVVDPLVAFDCRTTSTEKVGTHYVFFGEVEDTFISGGGSALIYANRSYGAATHIESPLKVRTGADGEAAESLSVGCFHTFGPYVIPGLAAGMLSASPGVRMNFVEGDQRRLQSALLAGEVELALLYDLYLPDGFSCVEMTELRPYVLLARGHPLSERAEVGVEELADEPMVLLGAPPSREYFLGVMRGAGVEPRVVFDSPSFETVRGLVGHGLGFTLLATKPASSVTYDGHALVSRPLRGEFEASRVVLAQNGERVLSGAGRIFSEVCGKFFARELF
ncbi:MAG: LysR substrate-binding domain-containing protein [Alphaproteobacteria bacterium]|nr:LysR substrate-binding domain-containing protein [Alphaproteobacteria bacterium]MDA7987882.1 LysR substrate-binding domain-containing protein [Alphaproteobacteria bacterium]MDA8000552.1 LysR substrate-binding domain-containing protein [Alphaproteobacteria bacterium]MDA8005240.1 LysR substrate-binding domain-containing protein [Alphaproteobacteria bacterium]MDA8013652.1 LysR substrate-binding domain-containing protein [Alphaproteobacteria bacterium]